MYHLHVSPVTRNKGRSVCAAAAYIAREKVNDLTQDMTFDYSLKDDKSYSEIIGFDGTREELWNLAEDAENRKDATTAREYEIALPRELTQIQRIELSQLYANWLHQEYDVVVDFSIHSQDHRTGKETNPHCHLLTSTRSMESNGKFSKLKVSREWSPQKRKLNGLCKREEELVNARKEWATIHNDYCQKIGLDKVIDHRSYEDQGIEKIPTIHLGPKATAQEKRGEKSIRGNRNRIIVNINKKFAELKQEIILENIQLTEQAKPKTQGSISAPGLTPRPVFETKKKKEPVVEILRTPKKEEPKPVRYEPEYIDEYDEQWYPDPYGEDPYYYPYKTAQDWEIAKLDKEIEQAELAITVADSKADKFISGENKRAELKAEKTDLKNQNLWNNRTWMRTIIDGIRRAKPPEKTLDNLVKKTIEDYPELSTKKETARLEFHKEERQEKGNKMLFRKRMKLLDQQEKNKPKIEKSHNYIIDVEPVITPPSEDFATAQELEELASAAEQEFKDMEQKPEEEKPKPSDNSPSF